MQIKLKTFDYFAENSASFIYFPKANATFLTPKVLLNLSVYKTIKGFHRHKFSIVLQMILEEMSKAYFFTFLTDNFSISK